MIKTGCSECSRRSTLTTVYICKLLHITVYTLQFRLCIYIYIYIYMHFHLRHFATLYTTGVVDTLSLVRQRPIYDILQYHQGHQNQ